MGPPIARPLGGYRPQDVRERYRLDPECRDGRVGERADVLTLGEAVSNENPPLLPRPPSIGCSCREISPGAHFQSTQRAEELPIIQAGQPEGQGEKEWVRGRAQRGGEAKGGVHTQRPKAASPDKRGWVGTDEVALALLEELTAGDLCSSGEETPDRQCGKAPALLKATGHGPYTQVDLVGEPREAQTTLGGPYV